ncbi:MAG: acetylornithine/succinylornithine family transaminase [Eubacterium sp.]|nr:acetylornithine/succinylornithine family transaminase [Eubacterium sp.]
MKLSDFNMTKEELIETAHKYLNESLMKRYDVVAQTGHDMYLVDATGEEYLDFIGGIAVNATGHCNEAVVAAIKEQADCLIHSSNYFYSIPQTMLAKLVCESIGMEKFQYQNSGAEANEAMIKLARKYGNDNFGPKRNKIVTAYSSFHGRTLATVMATGQPETAIQKGFGEVEGFKYAEFNNLESFEAACDDEVIAVMVEPVQGEGGVYPATKEFLQGLRELCDRKGMLLLFDEVQTGWGRTGDLMAFMSYGVKPDVVSMAKALGGGMPIAAICASERVMSTFGAGAHGTTFGGNPVCCAAAYAEVNEIIEKKLPENAKEVGAYLKEKLAELPHVKESRGMGLLVGAEFDSDIAAELKHLAADRHLLFTVIKPNTIRMIPPLIVTKEQCDTAVNILKECLNSIS